MADEGEGAYATTRFWRYIFTPFFFIVLAFVLFVVFAHRAVGGAPVGAPIGAALSGIGK